MQAHSLAEMGVAGGWGDGGQPCVGAVIMQVNHLFHTTRTPTATTSLSTVRGRELCAAKSFTVQEVNSPFTLKR